MYPGPTIRFKVFPMENNRGIRVETIYRGQWYAEDIVIHGPQNAGTWNYMVAKAVKNLLDLTDGKDNHARQYKAPR